MIITLLTAPVLPALAVLTFAQEPQSDTAQRPQAPAVEPEASEVQPQRVCRYVRRTGSTLQERVCSDTPPQRATGNVHSMLEARDMLRRQQGSRRPDGG